MSKLHAILAGVEKPARYVGGEYNQTVKAPESVRVRVALAFPDVYEIGVSYYGYKILYERLNALPRFAAERVYAPWPDFEAKMREAAIPLFSLENFSPLAEFDVIGFTLQAEVNFSNVVNMLDLAGLPVRAADRPAPFPLVIAGGEGALAPEPMSRFIDAFVIGDAEEAILDVAAAVERFKDEGGAFKGDLLARLAPIEGVYVPSQVEFDYHDDGRISAMRLAPTPTAPAPTPPTPPNLTTTSIASIPSIPSIAPTPPPTFRRRVWDLRSDPGPLHPIVPNMRVIHDRQVVEIRRGCARGCRFCHAGMTNRPVRERLPEQIIEAARQGLDATGYSDLSLLSLSATDYTRIGTLAPALVDAFAQRNVALSLPSLRINSFDIELATQISRVRKTGFTFAPEAGTERLRAVINKQLDDETFLSVVRQVFEHGWSTVKFYFMIGLPTETDEDIQGIVTTILAAEEMGRAIWGKRLQINVTISPFVPKPHTPFQWAAQVPMEEMKRRFYLARDGLRKSSRIDVKFTEFQGSFLEAALARGDRRVGKAIEKAWRRGAKMDGWAEHFQFDLWRQAFEECGLDMAWYAQRERPLDEILPWDHIDVGVGRAFLEKEWALALDGVAVPDCTRDECAGCRACRLWGEHQLAEGKTDRQPLASVTEGQPSPPSQETGSKPVDLSKHGRRKPPERGAAPAVARLRLRFSKSGRMRYVSHLDLMNVISMSLARVGLPLAYSKGFHPRPMMTFPPPLPLGYGAEEEPLDVSLTARVNLANVCESLNAASPDGLRFSRAEAIALDAKSFAAQAVAGDYLIEAPEGVIDEQELREAFRRFEAAKEWPFNKATKSGVRLIDLKKSLHVGEYDARAIQLLVSLAEGKFADPLQTLSEILARPLTMTDGLQVTRRRIIM